MSADLAGQLEAAEELAEELQTALQEDFEAERFERRLEELTARCGTLVEHCEETTLEEAELERLVALKEQVDELSELAQLHQKRLSTRLRHLKKSDRTLDSYSGGELPVQKGGLDRTG